MENCSQKSKFWQELRDSSKALENKMNPLLRKRTGSFYTALELTDSMMEELVNFQLAKKTDMSTLTFLEPAVGTGHFVFSYLRQIDKLGYSKEKRLQVLDNIFVADINKEAVNIYKQFLKKFALEFWHIELAEGYFEVHTTDGLLIDVESKTPTYIDIKGKFPVEVVEKGFDIIATNPPYKNLKAERSQYEAISHFDDDKAKYKVISECISKKLFYSVNGTLNLYKLFVEEIFVKYLSGNGVASLLIPSSILSDKTCSELRKYLLTKNNIMTVKSISENNPYIDAKQSLSAIFIEKGTQTTQIEIINDFHKAPEKSSITKIESILNEKTENAIFSIDKQDSLTIKQLSKFPTIKDLDFIINLRGELDLTLNKNYITNENTGISLVRGKNIAYYECDNNSLNEFVMQDFILSTKKAKYVSTPRIACQQVVNIKKQRRVTFALVDANNVLGNSCNFIAVENNEYGINLFNLLGLLNSKLINWYFKLSSSNNHVNNYEIDMFPIPVKAKQLKGIEKLVKNYLLTENAELLDKIDVEVNEAYGLSDNYESDELEVADDTTINLDGFGRQLLRDLQSFIQNLIPRDVHDILNGSSTLESILLRHNIVLNKLNRKIAEGLIDKYKKLYKGQILNHTTFKLSDLDLEMIRPIPQGGNWKNIPEETINKSERLKKITQTGGRTTLYGRIDYNKPSYTITTYFNRPGNGTYVHPIHDRVLSVREAARFQCFPDDYYIYGNKTQMLDQIGNAVPTLLAYHIGKEIVSKAHCSKSLDLFCGAGGLTVGFKEAGIKSILSNDIEESACVTLKLNNPEIEVCCGDITSQEVKNSLISKAIEKKVDIICGGPPCQGFSMAGFRDSNDSRNLLVADFIDVISKVKPKVVVFENVEGLLSFQGGATYKEIIKLFSETGYNAEGRVLLASNYGVPQKRKRVIVICTRTDLKVTPSELFPKAITPEPTQQVTAKETIADLEDVLCNEEAQYQQREISNIVKMFKKEISFADFCTYKSNQQFGLLQYL